MMLTDRPEEQSTLFKEIMFKKLTVREAEAIARKIAFDKVRKKDRAFDPELVELEEKLTESLGTRVHIERKDNGGKVMIDFFSNDDLRTILNLVQSNIPKKGTEMMEKAISDATPLHVSPAAVQSQDVPDTQETLPDTAALPEAAVDDRAPVEKQEAEDSEDLYSIKNFSI